MCICKTQVTHFWHPRLTVPRCIFMIDPTLTRSVTRGQFVHDRSVSETTVSLSPTVDQPDEYSGDVMMSPAELRVIRRLSARVNVLPVIAKADSLTDESLSAVKTAVREGLRHAGLGFGVFSTPKHREKPHSHTPSQEEVVNGLHNGVNGTTHYAENGDSHGVTDDDTEKDRVSRTVITLKGTHATRSRSRSRRDLSSIAQDEREPQYPDETEEETIANIRFSAQTVSKVNLDTLLPFALIAPESSSSPQPQTLRPATADSKYSRNYDDAEGTSSPETAASPDTMVSRKSAACTTLPKSLQGMFTRKFRWGTVDVLNPEHCDFAALRTAILLTHMKVSVLHFTWQSCHSRIYDAYSLDRNGRFSRPIPARFCMRNTELRSFSQNVPLGP